MTYKQLQDPIAARQHLEAAVSLQPRINNALPELIDLLYQCGKIEEAKKWISVAQKDSLVPAQIYFLKGLVLLKEGADADEAIAAFERAAKFDPSLTDTVMYYKGLAYMQSLRLKEARTAFQNIVTHGPATDLCAFANEYIGSISRKEEMEKPFHANIGAGLHYDDNVIQQPDDPALGAASGNKYDWRQVYTARADYTIGPNGRFSSRIGYSGYFAKQFDLHFYDMVSHDVSLQPALKLRRWAVSSPVHFNRVYIDDRKYLDILGLGVVTSRMFGANYMGQVTFQYNVKNYMFEVTQPDEDRDAKEYLGSLGWYYFFTKKQEGLINFRYTANYDNTDGENWRYFGNCLSVSSTIPLMKKVKLNLCEDYSIQDYLNTNSIYAQDRQDGILTTSSLLAFGLTKDVELQIQYIFVNNKSNIGIYEYKRNVYQAGMKYTF